jgi:hypothetical protein
MPLPTFATQDEIPEPFRDAYEEQGGVWAPKADEKGPTRKEIERREAAAVKRARELEERTKELEQELHARAAGVAPEELQKIRRAVEAEWKGKVEEVSAKLHEATFGQQLNALLADADVIDLEDGRTVFGPRFELSESGALVPKEDKSIPAKQYVASKLRAEKPHLFKGTQADGGGARGAQGKARATGKLSWEEFQKMSPAERDAYAAQAA